MDAKQSIETLKKEELALFHSYNRHANAQFKIDILQKLIRVISKLEVLEALTKK